MESNLKKERNKQAIKNPLLCDSVALSFGRNIFFLFLTWTIYIYI
jgi:hypothetical protein